MFVRSLIVSCLIVLCLTTAPVVADLELPSVFSDSMVLQRELPIRVWGWAASDREVVVSIGDEKKATTAGADGRWSLKLKPMSAGGPHVLTVEGDGKTIQVRDVYVGEVWLCSGQSNMAMTVNRAASADSEVAAAKWPRIRMFKVDSAHALEPQDRCSGSWSVCTPETVGGFSATAYFFGRRLHNELDVPVGLINSSVGGTSIESWTSLSAQKTVEQIKPRLDAWMKSDADYNESAMTAAYEKSLAVWQKRAAAAKSAGTPAPRKPRQSVQPHKDRNFPGNLFNGKINPLVGFTIRGAIWYQGENSAGAGFGKLYGSQLTTLIADWRSRWGQGDFPFGWVQLPNFRTPQVEPVETTGWVLVQEGMLQTLSVPHTGMAVTIDVGEARDIHPKDKQTVGHRMAQWALADVYKKTDLISMGPLYRVHSVRGSEVVIEFRHADGLKAKNGKVDGFAIAGADRKFVRADARIENSTVVISSDAVLQPVAVRYAWAENPVFSLYNSAGIPASPFRTDDWED